jgi:two-component system, sensor histidine kinase PdtaS
MPLTQFKSVRLRLLAGMALIIAPVAALSVLMASATYQSLLDGIEASETRATSYFAARTLAWFRGASRSLLTVAASVDPSAGSVNDCEAALRRVIAANHGYVAISVRFENGQLCEASVNGSVGADELRELAQGQASRAHGQLVPGADEARERFDAIRTGGRLYLVVDIIAATPQGSGVTALLLVDPKLLEDALKLDGSDRGVTFAVMKRGGELIAARGAGNGGASWLPEAERLSPTTVLWRAASRAGDVSCYGGQMISEPDLYVISRFDGQSRRAAWQQFLILCATPLLTLLLLLYVYTRILQKDVLYWIQAIDASARSQMAERGEALPAPVDPEMPVELRSVSESFNALVADADRREDMLRGLLQINRELMRELHHRVKNSLQIIQSYLALSRREQKGLNRRALEETEARVQVLASAYRLGLTAGGMGLVPVKPFLDEVVENVVSFACEPQGVSLSIEWCGAMIIDRVIPLGLAVVEALLSAYAAPGVSNVKIVLCRFDDVNLELSIVAVGAQLNPPSKKIMGGLAAQLSAQQEYCDEGRKFTLTFPP